MLDMWGCFDPLEPGGLPNTLCVNGLYDCKTCRHCDGSIRGNPGGIQIPWSGGGYDWDDGINILPRKPYIRMGRIPTWQWPQPGNIEYCLMAAITACFANYKFLWDKFTDYYKLSLWGTCIAKCSLSMNFIECITGCGLLRLFLGNFRLWLRKIADPAAVSILRYCICDKYVECFSRGTGDDDPDRWRHEDCCIRVLRNNLYPHLNPVDALYDCYKNKHEGGGYFL